MRRFPIGLLAAALIYAALRGSVLHLAFDQVALVNYELYPMGTLAKALSLGVDFPLRLYYDNAAGQLVTGFAAWPSYALFGDSYLALKLVPAAAGLGMLCCVWALLDRHASRRAANFAALALALGPAELLFKYSLFASGNHFENLFFTALAILCAYRVHVAPAARRRRWLLAAGAAAGLAIFVFLGALVPVGLLALVHLGVRGWRGSLEDLRAAGPAFLVGVAPLVALNLGSGARGAGFLEAKFQADQARDWGRVAGRMRAFVATDLPRAGFFRSFAGVSPRVPNLVLLACFAAAWLAALPAALGGAGEMLRGAVRGRRVDPDRAFARLRVAPFVLYVPLTTLAFGLSNLRTGGHPAPIEVAGYRYLLPTFLFGVVLVAVVVDRAWSAGGARRALGGLLAAATLATGAWTLSWIDPPAGTRGMGTHYRGWNFTQAARGLFNHTVGLAHEERLVIAAAMPAPHRAHLYRGLGFHEAQGWIVATAGERGGGDLDVVRGGELPVEELLARYPEDARLQVARGMGAGLRTYVLTRGPSDELIEIVAAGLERAVAAQGPWAWAVLEGAATQEDYPPPWRKVPVVLGRSQRLLERLPEGLRETYGRGLGEVCGRLLARRIEAEERWVRTYLYGLFPSVGSELLVGVGRGLAIEGESPRVTSAALELTAAPELRAALRKGFEEGLRAVYPPERIAELLAGPE